ncbi:MFS general substrate transporter [Dendrothele bispora CBS 962.96]|uniref:MFS general substrate transporter n=1 Tax=Dendrothele bispora (strain CBS 962.96) TaxID=1314807 RepID=A0A4S8LNU8_DENBC|nr:MFS general substrate transporter [Dendrothele bispora CBS 962.96]
MASADTLELATRVPLPKSSSTVYLAPGRTHPTLSPEDRDSDPDIPRLNESSLPPMDGGLQAWSYLIASFFVEVIVWGFPITFGVFLDDYLNDPFFVSQTNSEFLLPLIGPVSTGIMYCSGPFLNRIFKTYPYHRRNAMRLGAVICTASLLGASWAGSIYQLLALQGVVYAIGGALLYHPTLSYLPTWFLSRRGFANGVIFAGTSVGGVLLPFILPPLLQKYGSKVTLRWLAVSVGVGLIPSLIWVKPRVPDRRPDQRIPARTRTSRMQSESLPQRVWGYMKEQYSWWLAQPAFLILLLANTVQAFGYFMPIIWLPTYASSLNLSRTNSSLVLALLNAGSVVGRLGLGFLSDKLDPWVLAFGTLVSTTLSVFVLWGVCSFNLGGLLAFGLFYGVFAGGWGTIWTGFIKKRPGQDDPNLASTLFGYLMLSRGIGNIFSTPISTVLSSASDSATNASTGFSVSNHRFQNLILYVGTCFAAAAGVMLIGWGREAWKTRKADGQRGFGNR